MKRKSFTLIEILVGVIIITILASLSMASYRKTVETNNEKICKENLKTLQAAIDIYTLENGSLPATLAQLTPRQIYLAHSQVVGEAKENSLTGALKNIFGVNTAVAQSPPTLPKYYSNNRNVFRDPSDTTTASPPAPGSCTITPGIPFSCGSYTFNFEDGKTLDNSKKILRKLSARALIYDNNATRHRGTMLGITSGGIVGKAANDGYVKRAKAKGIDVNGDCSQESYEQLRREKED